MRIAKQTEEKIRDFLNQPRPIDTSTGFGSISPDCAICSNNKGCIYKEEIEKYMEQKIIKNNEIPPFCYQYTRIICAYCIPHEEYSNG